MALKSRAKLFACSAIFIVTIADLSLCNPIAALKTGDKANRCLQKQSVFPSSQVTAILASSAYPTPFLENRYIQFDLRYRLKSIMCSCTTLKTSYVLLLGNLRIQHDTMYLNTAIVILFWQIQQKPTRVSFKINLWHTFNYIKS